MFAYTDDIAMAADKPEEHNELLAKVLDMLLSCGLRAHPEKSVFGARVIAYLGHNVSAAGLSPQQAKVEAIRAMPAPASVSDLRSQLGFYGYYRCYVQDYSQLARPLNSLLQQNAKWKWGPEQRDSWSKHKDELCKPGKVLRHFDPSRPTIVHTDWSKLGISGVLGQLDSEGKEYLRYLLHASVGR